MTNTPETIYLIPGENMYGEDFTTWSDSPTPGPESDPDDAVKYIRADKHQEIIDRQAGAAKMGMDAAKKSGAAMYEHGKKMLAESSPEALESERAANAVLTDRVEALETMVGCIETQRFPAKESPCHDFVIQLVGERDDNSDEEGACEQWQ